MAAACGCCACGSCAGAEVAAAAAAAPPSLLWRERRRASEAGAAGAAVVLLTGPLRLPLSEELLPVLAVLLWRREWVGCWVTAERGGLYRMGEGVMAGVRVVRVLAHAVDSALLVEPPLLPLL